MAKQADISEFADNREQPGGSKTVRLKHLAEINPTKSEISHQDPKTEVSFVALEDFGTDGEIKNSETRALDEVYDGYTYFQEGDIAIAKITPSFENGKGAICRNLKNGIGFGTTELHILRPREGVSTEFLWYVLRSRPFVDEAKTAMRGVAGQQRVPSEYIENFRVESDTLAQQSEYTDYISSNLPEIENSIKKSEELIQKVRNRKPRYILSEILQNEDGSECDSISWISQIPIGFRETRLKYITHSLIDSEHKTAPERDGEYNIIRTTDVRDGRIQVEGAKTTTKDVYEEWTARGTPESGDLIFTREAPAGEVGVVPEESNILLGQRTVLLKLDRRKVRPEYLNYYLQTEIVDWFIARSSQGSTVEHLNVSDLKNIPVLLPELEKQDSMISQISNVEARSREIVKNLRGVKALLKEKRQALITAAVTGQIDVSDE